MKTKPKLALSRETLKSLKTSVKAGANPYTRVGCEPSGVIACTVICPPES
jgi:hypothetical protein